MRNVCSTGLRTKYYQVELRFAASCAMNGISILWKLREYVRKAHYKIILRRNLGGSSSW